MPMTTHSQYAWFGRCRGVCGGFVAELCLLASLSSLPLFVASGRAVLVGLSVVLTFGHSLHCCTAGQGTMGLEVLREAEALGGDPDMIFVAIGGGGMIAGGHRPCWEGQGLPGVRVGGMDTGSMCSAGCDLCRK